MGIEGLIAASIASAATATAGSVINVIAARNQANFQSKIAEQNAEIARNNARAEAARVADDRRRSRARTLAGLGASGAGVGTGSALSLEIDQAIESELDVGTALVGGEVRARESEIQRTQALATRRNVTLGGVLSGVSSVARGGVQAGIIANS